LQDPSRFAASPHDLLQASAFLKELGNYKQSINLVSKAQYTSDHHDLLYPLGFRQDIEETAAMHSVDPLFILSVIREESRFDPEARSIAGALGLMQLMPQTAQRFSKSGQVRLSRNSELFDVRTNIRIGTAYMKHLLKAYSSLPVALAAYNAGEEAVREWLRRGDYRTIDEFIEDIPYDETRNYVKRVMTTYFEYLRSIPGNSTEKIQKQVGTL
ncbi:MAG TPA: lytic transglycosylase domain-containing protein, partial [Dissulfurispiraceae bacterium]|nr:lytic transglycosylase domain-containing protein [Dissulfurispiraceae bacterium]